MSSKNKPAKSSCNKVKNPCKFCLQQVTNKNGLQCQGACKKWAHFKCLNYTPGKISDIKAGIIKVTCPCPDCDTTQVKEFLTNPPYTCSNHACPANRGTPKCDSFECPSNKKKKQNASVPVVDYSSCANPQCSNEVIDCPAAECPNLSAQKPRRSYPRMPTPRPPTPPRKNKSPPGSPRKSPKGKSFFGKVKKGTKKKPSRKSPSCSLLSSENSMRCPGAKSSSSESNCAPRNQASMVAALQEMCGTVGQLSVQLKELMCKMMNA